MTEIEMEPESLAGIFRKYLPDAEWSFVFPSAVVKDGWADWCVLNPEVSGTSAVDMTRFTEWDRFKSEFMSAAVPGRAAVQPEARRLFAARTIRENASDLFFRRIISPEFADSAEAFTEWISGILPQLGLWRERYYACLEERGLEAGDDPDCENRDLLLLYRRYSEFLDRNALFEPSWVLPDFSVTDRKFVLIYPEVLDDFCRYRGLLEPCGNVVSVVLPKAAVHGPECAVYPDSRTELRRTALLMRKLACGGTPWSSISLSVPDIDTYRPYIEREFSEYGIPFAIGAGTPLSSCGAGRIFREIKECHDSGFSYQAVRTLLSDGYVPWLQDGGAPCPAGGRPVRTDMRRLRDSLVREGSRLRCICGYTDDDGRAVDVWEKALSECGGDEAELSFYRRLKRGVSAVCRAGSFSALRQAWFKFREDFLDPGSFSGDADNVISRCVKVLDVLAGIEERFGSAERLVPDSPFSFFLAELGLTKYVPVQDRGGVRVFPYRVAAGAPFMYSFVIDASQRNLDVPSRQLPFLSGEKRALLGFPDSDPLSDMSVPFIRLYGGCSLGRTFFSSAEQTFGGFAVPYGWLSSAAAETSALDDDDFILMEKRWIVSGASGSSPSVTARQSGAGRRWLLSSASCSSDRRISVSRGSALDAAARFVLTEKRGSGDCLVLTQNDMRKFFPCPRRWIFSVVLDVRKDTLDTDLMSVFDMGNLYHRILELVMRFFCGQTGPDGRELEKKGNPVPLPCTNKDGLFNNEDEVRKIVDNMTYIALSERRLDLQRSPLAMAALSAQSEEMAVCVMDFLHVLCRQCVRKDRINTKTSTEGFGGYYVRDVEAWKSAPCAETDGVLLSGKIDCILEAEIASGCAEPVIIDYKNTMSAVPASGAVRPDDAGRLGDFQMPLYALLVNGGTYGGVEAAYFYSVHGDGSSSKRFRLAVIDSRTAGKSVEDFRPAADAVRKYAAEFRDAVEAGAYSPDPGLVEPYSDGGCRACEFRGICRYTYSVGGRMMAGTGGGER